MRSDLRSSGSEAAPAPTGPGRARAGLPARAAPRGGRGAGSRAGAPPPAPPRGRPGPPRRARDAPDARARAPPARPPRRPRPRPAARCAPSRRRRGNVGAEAGPRRARAAAWPDPWRARATRPPARRETAGREGKPRAAPPPRARRDARHHAFGGTRRWTGRLGRPARRGLPGITAPASDAAAGAYRADAGTPGNGEERDREPARRQAPRHETSTRLRRRQRPPPPGREPDRLGATCDDGGRAAGLRAWRRPGGGDRVTVMKNGKVVGTARTVDVAQDEVLGMIISGKCPPMAVAGPGALRS
ncbi:hypothetical protein BTHI11S_00744 [Bosea thiooxidans]